MIVRREDGPPAQIGEVLCPVIGFRGDQRFAVGTCVVISDRLAVSARHVAQEIHDKFSLTPFGRLGSEADYHASIVTIGTQLVWGIRGIYFSPISDIALLYFLPTEGNDDTFEFKKLTMNFNLPKVDDVVTVWGIADQATRVHQGFLQVGGHPFRSTGLVQEVFPFGRDKYLMTWPSASVKAHLKGGMSGGPVFNAQGELCGIASSSLEDDDFDNNPLMYFSLLWPMLPLHLSAPRSDLPVGTKYAFRHLIEKGFVSAVNWDADWLGVTSKAWGELIPYGPG